MRGKNMVKLIKTVSLLSRPNGVTRKEMAEALKISDRSVSRAINVVQDLCIPVYDHRPDGEKEKRWVIESSYLKRMPNLSLPDLGLNFPEILSLCMLAGESVVFQNTEIERHITTAIAKLMTFVPEKTRKDLSSLKRIFISKTVGSKNYMGREKIIAALTECMLNRTGSHITYHAFYTDQMEETDIGPLHFYENSSGLYIFGVKLKDKIVRSYAVERIQTTQPLKCDIPYPKNFDPAQRLNSGFNLTHGEPVSVKIRFSPAEARYIREKTWAENQHITDHPDGTLTLSMTTSGYRDVKRWVMSFGKAAEILEPEGMKREIEVELREVLETMGKTKASGTVFVGGGEYFVKH